MNLRNPIFSEIIADNTYPVLLTIATFRAEDQDDDRGKFYFGNDEGQFNLIVKKYKYIFI